MAKPWTQKEVAILIRIMKSDAKLKDCMHCLPGRTYGSAMWKSMNVGIRPPTTADSIRNLMKDGIERTAREIAEALNLEKKSVADFLRTATEPGLDQEMYAVRLGRRKARVYAVGQGENVSATPSCVPEEDLSDADLDRKYRASARWWPHADLVVITAINAMVHAGRAAA